MNILSEPSRDLKVLAAETISNVGKVRLARKLIRKYGGIPKIVDLLDVPLNCLITPKENLTQSQKEQLNMARAGKALCNFYLAVHEILCFSQQERELYGHCPSRVTTKTS